MGATGEADLGGGFGGSLPALRALSRRVPVGERLLPVDTVGEDDGGAGGGERVCEKRPERANGGDRVFGVWGDRLCHQRLEAGCEGVVLVAVEVVVVGGVVDDDINCVDFFPLSFFSGPLCFVSRSLSNFFFSSSTVLPFSRHIKQLFVTPWSRS